jgi:hypothetical protein
MRTQWLRDIPFASQPKRISSVRCGTAIAVKASRCGMCLSLAGEGMTMRIAPLPVFVVTVMGCWAPPDLSGRPPVASDPPPASTNPPSDSSAIAGGDATSPGAVTGAPVSGSGCAGEAAVVARFPDLDAVSGLATDSDSLFVAGGNIALDAASGVSHERGSVRRVSRDGQTATEVWQGTGTAREVAATPSYVFISAFDYQTREGQLIRVDRRDSNAESIGTWNAHGTCTALAMGSDDSVAWSYSTGGEGGAVTLVSSSGAQTTLFRGATCQNGLPIADGRAYWLTYTAIMGARTDGSETPITVFETPAHLTAVALSTRQQYLFAATDTVIAIVTRADGTLVGEIQSAADISTMAADDRYVYWYDLTKRSIMRSRFADKGAPEAFVCNQDSVPAMIVDGPDLYWLTTGPESRTLNRALLPQ